MFTGKKTSPAHLVNPTQEQHPTFHITTTTTTATATKVLKQIDGIRLRSGIVLSWFKTTTEGPSPSLLPSASAKCLAQEPGNISCAVETKILPAIPVVLELMGYHGESPTWILIIHLFGRVTGNPLYIYI